jgi:lysylphosphatidylglycerol synthetase-like protein (DUF2156 family)
MATRDTDTLRRWESWVLFAALMLIIIGAVNVIQGFIGLLARSRTVVVQDQLYVVNLTGWAWTVLIFGAVLILVGGGLLSGQSWARWAAIFVVVVHAVVQMAWLTAYPLWGLLMLALDIVVLYALTARWPGKMAQQTADYAPPQARVGAHDSDTYGRDSTYERETDAAREARERATRS